MKYQANPVIVDAFKIVDVSEMAQDGTVHCALENDDAIEQGHLFCNMLTANRKRAM